MLLELEQPNVEYKAILHEIAQHMRKSLSRQKKRGRVDRIYEIEEFNGIPAPNRIEIALKKRKKRIYIFIHKQYLASFDLDFAADRDDLESREKLYAALSKKIGVEI